MTDTDDAFATWLGTLDPTTIERERCIADIGFLRATEAVSRGNLVQTPATIQQEAAGKGDRITNTAIRKLQMSYAGRLAATQRDAFAHSMREAGYRVDAA